MTTSEIAFLAVGLVIGAAIGGALAQVLRARPSRRGEVRLTITPNAIPAGRIRTLTVPNGSARPGLVPGSPEHVALADAADQAEGGRPGEGASRTRVPSGPVTLPATAVALPVGEAEPAAAPRRVAAEPPPGDRPPADADTTRARRDGLESAAAGRLAVAVGTVAVLDRVDEPALPGLADTGFATLVRPRPPVADPPRPSVPGHAVPVTAPAPPPVRPGIGAPLPPTRLAPPSAPTLTRPRASVRTVVALTPGTADAAPGTNGRARAHAADRDGQGGTASRASEPGTASRASEPGTAPCAGARRVVEERCALAEAARDQARLAADALHEAQRAYDVLRDRVDRAEAIADPRRVAAEKDRLHAAFRAASERAGGSDETERAARAWLDQINDLNASVREALRIAEQGLAELRASLPVLERRAMDADAARIAAENAETGCRDARADLAECEEAEARARQAPPPPPAEPHPFDAAWPADRPELPGPADLAAPADRLAGLPAITRILRGDRAARDRLVATLAAGDPDGEREWQLRVARLVDAIVGRAIEDGYLDLPDDDPFWRLFEHREARDIIGALSALGFRYDGMGGFADGRAPAARDLSLAVGYAGLDRMRIRTWPRESETGELYRRAEVAADEWLADQAGDLSLGRMVDALGGRAAELADVWNAWGRVRPALLET